MRFPRRFAPRNDTGGRHSQARRCAPPNGKGPQVCHCEPCGARRGNLAVPAGARESPGEVEGAYLRLPRRACALLAMTREGGACKFVTMPLRMGWVSPSCHCILPVAAGSQVCHCEPCGARRGNLAGCSRNAERPPANSLLPSRDCRVGLRPPRNDTGGRRTQVCPCVPPEAAGSQTCHCEAPQEPRRRPSRRERPGAIAISAPFPPFPIFSALFAGC